ncbi:HSPB1 protein, partial [Polypterus senegalus]|nr:HSPB1 protein [Polypterus senegalus]
MSHLRRTPPPAAFCCDPLCMFGLGSGVGPFRDEISGLWMEWARRHHFAVWQSYIRSSAWAALNHEHGPEITQPREGSEDWRVNLDVKQFSPEELTIHTNAKHEERQDEDGFVSRNFLWKYKLPVGVDIQDMQAYMFPSGVLIINAPLPKSAHKAPKHIAIQIKVEKRLYEQYSQPGEGQGEDLVQKPPDHPDLHNQFTAREKEGPSLTEQHEKRMEDPSAGLDITDDPAEQEAGPGAFKKSEGAPAEQLHTLSSGPLEHIEQQDTSISEEGHDLNAEKEDPYAPGEQEGGSSAQQDPPDSEEQKDRQPEQHDSHTSGEQDVNTAQHDTVASEENQNIQPEQQDPVDFGPLGDTQGSEQVPPNSEEQGKMPAEDKDPLTSDEQEDKKSTQQDPTTSVEVEDTKSTQNASVSGEVEDKQTMQQDPLAFGEQVDTHVMQQDSATPGEDTRFTKQNHEDTLVEEQDPLTSAEQEDAHTAQQDPFPLGKVHDISPAQHNLLAFGEQEDIQAVKEDLTATEEKEVGACDPRMQKEVLSEQWDPFESGDQDDAQISKKDLHASEGEDDKRVTQDPVFSGEQGEIQSTEAGLPALEQDDTQALLEGSTVSEGQEDPQISQEDSLVFEKQDRMPAAIVDAEGSGELEETEHTEHDPTVCKQKEDTQEKHQDPFTTTGQEGIPQDPSATGQQEDAPSGQWDLPSLHKLGEQGDQSASAEQPGPFAFGEHDEQMTQQESLTLGEDENAPDSLTSGEQGFQVVQQDPPVMEEHDDICDECQGPTSSAESEDIQVEQKHSEETEDTTLEHQHLLISGEREDAHFVQEDPFGSGEKEENLNAMSEQEERQDTPQDPSSYGGQGEAEATQQDPPISGKQEETLTLQRDQLASEEQGDTCISQDPLTVERAAQTE